MTPAEIPRELRDILDRAAGKEHGETGPVMTALAEILTRYDEIRIGEVRRLREALRRIKDEEDPTEAEIDGYPAESWYQHIALAALDEGKAEKPET